MRAGEFARAATHYIGAQWRWRRLDPARLQVFQDERARKMVANAHARSPFYRAHWAGHDLANWRELPPVDKATMMDNFDAFNTRGVRGDAAMNAALLAEHSRDFRPQLDGFTVGLSSGTSGHRGLFLVSPREQAAWAGVILARALHGIRMRRTRVAFFLRSHSNLYAQASGTLIDLRYFDLMMPLAEAVTALNRYLPTIIVGPPSLLGFLADAQEDGALLVTPERLISVAEVLEPQDQARLEQAFQAPVHQIYQCTEGLLAVSCAEGRLHLQEDIVAIEFSPLSPWHNSTTGSHRVAPIVTDLWRTTQPIIRYRLNDVLQLDPRPCPCGNCFQVIAAIEGRSDDICYFPDKQGMRRPFFPDTIRRMVLLSDPEIVDYQVVQTVDGQVDVHLRVALPSHFAATAADLRRNIENTLAQYGCSAQEITIVAGLPPQPPGTKRRRVRRLPQG